MQKYKVGNKFRNSSQAEKIDTHEFRFNNSDFFHN